MKKRNSKVKKKHILGKKSIIVIIVVIIAIFITIVNSENAVITGKKAAVFSKYKTQVDRGVPSKGPFVHRSPERLLRRSIRGMLPSPQTTRRKPSLP